MKVAIHTLGCKLNRMEGIALGEAFHEAGFEVVPLSGESDAVILNTCAVTGPAEAEARKLIRRLARAGGKPVVVVGCMAERDRAAAASLPGVLLVHGVRDKAAVVGRVADLLGRTVAVPDARRGDFPPLDGFGGRTRAYVKVQDGCDNRCTYCVVHVVRGRSRSQRADLVVAQVSRFAAMGFREVVLTGVHLGAWGRDLDPPDSLPGLLQRLTALPDLPRLRLSSLEPQEIDLGLAEAVSSHPAVCRHAHVPLQSGSDRVLSAMNRNYTAAEYRRRVSLLTGRWPGMGLGADVIVGFPGETAEDFEATRALVDELPFTYLHVFPFSPRPGTPAASLPGRVSPSMTTTRADRLRALARDKGIAWRRGHLGRTLSCLTESRRDPETGLLRGLTDTYLRVLYDGPDTLMNTIQEVRVENQEGLRLFGAVAP